MRRILSCALFSAAVTACVSADGKTRFAAGGLDGQWRIVRLNELQIQGSLRLDRGRMTISFGCNHGSGPFRIVSGRLVPSEGLAVTEMACQPANASAPDPMAVEAKGFRIASKPMWIAGTRDNRRLRLWNEQGWLLAEYLPGRP